MAWKYFLHYWPLWRNPSDNDSPPKASEVLGFDFFAIRLDKLFEQKTKKRVASEFGIMKLIWRHCNVATRFSCRYIDAIIHGLLKLQEPLLLIWVNFYPCMDKYWHSLHNVIWNYFSIPKLQRLLKFGNGEVISNHALLGMWILIYTWIKVNPC